MSPSLVLRTRAPRASGFTLLEILLAVALMGLVASVTFMTFSVGVQAWRRGQELSKDLQHGDYVADQLVMALRSAHYPDAKGLSPAYGFWMEDNGEAEYTGDLISWVKMGHSLVGKQCPFAESPHRVEFYLEEDEEGENLVAIKAWQLQGQPEDFDPEEDVEPIYLSNRVTGFNCRTAYRKEEDEIEWLDEWEETNRVPSLVEITLYLEPLEEGDETVELKRVLAIPIAPLAWRGFADLVVR